MRLWKLVGLAGLAGVAATGVVVARAERRRRAYRPEDVRARLHERHRAALAGGPRPPAVEGGRADAGRVAGGLVARGEVTLEEAQELTRTGDLWLFRGASPADRAIRAATNAPVNHGGMAVVLEDLPPLMWHAELGRSLEDMWTGRHHRGVQLHDLRAAVTTWSDRYGQQGWMRQLHAGVTAEMEDALLREIARQDGLAFPTTLSLVARWLRGRLRRRAPVEVTYCAEVVAGAYQAMGLLGPDRPTNWYDPGRFWSGDRLQLEGGATLGDEVRVVVPR